MIYTNNFFDQEISKSFMTTKNHKWRLFSYSVLLVAICFVISSAMQSIAGTVVSEALSMFTYTNAYSIISILNVICPLFIMFYLFIYYDQMTFKEITSNKMYMLVKMGENIKRIILYRILSTLAFSFSVYIVSCILSLVACLIFSYPLSLTTLPSLFIIGTISIVAVPITILCMSLYIKKRMYCLLTYFVFFVLSIIYACLAGFYALCSSTSKISYMANIFDLQQTSLFLIGILIFTGIMLGLSIVKSYLMINYYHTDKTILKDVVTIDYTSNEVVKQRKDLSHLKDKVTAGITYSFFGIICLAAFVTNIYLIFMGSKKLDSEVANGTMISVIFDSDTMAGDDKDILKNDFVTFKKVDKEYEIKVGDIVYFTDTESSTVMVEKVKYIADSKYTVDVNYYPIGTTEGSLLQTIDREDINGVLIYRSRALGAWTLFNESTTGKILMLGIPICVILFYDRLVILGKAYKKAEEESIK